ncbi:MAG: methionyl-tRNA formyltransferase [Armatimonadetes bacterium]|nr:MAG: methionyl-tRNA formyltransferase [Armatimonadota bacterium]
MGAIFLGTPAAAVPSLCALAEVEDIDFVITQPDRPMKRSSAAVPSPVKVAATQFGFPIKQPETSAELLRVLRASEATIGLVVAFGRILTPGMLWSLPMGFVNVHFSLLPRWRGAAPVERAIAAGDQTTGVTLMKIDEGLDTGPVIAERATDISAVDTGGSLTARLSHIGAILVDTAVPDYLNGRRIPVPQITTGASHAARLTKAEAMLSVTTSATDAERKVRAFSPRPGAWVATDAGRIKIHAATRMDQSENQPGEIGTADGFPALALTEGGLRLLTVQPEGKPAMDAEAWMRGRRGKSAVLIQS